MSKQQGSTPLSQQLPSPDEIARLYPDKTEQEALLNLRSVVVRLPTSEVPAGIEFGREILRKLWPDDEQYIAKNHWIRTKESGEMILFKHNYAQRELWKIIKKQEADKQPVRVAICKARQLGFSTMIQSYFTHMFDTKKLNSSLVISFDTDSTLELFQKCQFILKNLWFPRPLIRESKGVIEADAPWGSNMFVKTAGNVSAGRSQTFHAMHASELPMWQDTGETLLAANQAVPVKVGTYEFRESTSKGATGNWYDDWQKAEKGESSFYPFFAPWFWDPDYTLDFRDDEAKRVFRARLLPVDLDYMRRHKLSIEQMLWRDMVIRDKCNGSVGLFRQEYPATAQESFLTTGSPVFNADLVAKLQHNVRPPYWQGDCILIKSA